jgi:hypothetical protein
MKPEVSVQGATETARRLNAAGNESVSQAEVMRNVGERTRRGLRGVPVDTGTLAGSIDVVSGNFGFVVGTRVPYARFVFAGTRNMPAQPPRVTNNPGGETAQEVSHNVVRAAGR